MLRFPLRQGARRAACRWLSLAAGLGTLAACKGLADNTPPINRYAAINIRGANSGPTKAKATATMIVFEAYTAAIPISAQQRQDQCVYSSNDTTVKVVQGVLKAGAPVTLSFGGTTVSMPYDSLNARYASPVTSPFTYTGGDVVQATIPGDPAVFPATSISVRLAEPLIPGTIMVPTGTLPMTFTWNSSTDTTSSIILSLRYANPANMTYANEQIYCALSDDGLFQLPSTALTAFMASPNTLRSLVLTRWRTNEAIPNTRSVLHISSSVDTTLTFKP